jgi:chromosome segregation ATPase
MDRRPAPDAVLGGQFIRREQFRGARTLEISSAHLSQPGFQRKMLGLGQEGFDLTNGNDRLERIEQILDRVAKSQEQVAKSQEQAAGRHEHIDDALQEVTRRLQEMAARQQYHDEAFERHDAEMKIIREAIAADAENIRALARIAELHQRRLEHFEGGEAS